MSSKAGAWSYSKMKNFDTCPKQFYHVTVLKEHPFKETSATKYGNEFHKAAENFIGKDEPLPRDFKFAHKMLQALKDKPGEKRCELKMGITEDLKPCGFFDKKVWFRGIVDLAILDGDRAFIVDYKTGKSARYADPDQLQLMSLCIFAHFPQIKRTKGGLVFVLADEFVKADFDVNDHDAMWARWFKKYASMEQAFKNNVWNPIPSGLCRQYCPVVECAHNGANG